MLTCYSRLTLFLPSALLSKYNSNPYSSFCCPSSLSISLQREAGETSFEDTGSGLELGDNVTIMDVWTEGADKPVAEGSVSLVFFPHGFTQDALVHLQDEAGQVFTIKVWSLTGRAQVFNEYVEVK